MSEKNNKRKIINDPVYGFILIPSELIFDSIEHPFFQRLRRIKQLGLSSLVYPGAHHTRFQHVIGAMFLCAQAVEILKSKGVKISEEEKDAVCAAVLLHDIGHGPFSHTLEEILIEKTGHEEISLAIIKLLNKEMKGRLDLCLKIFENKYRRKFLHQLVSSQLDMDRLDYLRRDSFYTGVQEGVIGHDRIINMLNVRNDEIVIDEKGIYSIEKFLIARRLMYWQVYLHKTVIAAETLLVKIFQRAKFLTKNGKTLFASPALNYFLSNTITKKEFLKDYTLLCIFNELDDSDLVTSIKAWCYYPDKILSELCCMLRDRKLPHIEIQPEPFDKSFVEKIKVKVAKQKKITLDEATHFVFTDSVKNKAYSMDGFKINVLYKNGKTKDIADASDQLNITALASTVTKYFLCYPKNV